MLDLTNVKTIKKLLAEYNLRPSKAKGQIFLLSCRIIDKIIKAAELKKTDTVLEIGPGLGVLTLELAKRVKQVIAVEKDERFAEALKRNLEIEKLETKVEIINKDILEVTSYGLQVTDYKIVANLPYQITSPVLWKFLHEEKFKPKLLVLMMQKEVAERIVAQPGQMSLLSVLIQYYAEPSVMAQVKRTLFYPQPKVDSTVIKLKAKSEKRITNEDLFFNLVKAGFQAKRKTLKNNLKVLGFSQSVILNTLDNIKLSEKARAQELSIDDWLNLYKVMYNEESVKGKVQK